MKIGMILDKEFPPDPRVENEAKILVDNGFDLSIMSFNYGNKSKFENYLGIKIYRYPIKKMIKKKGTALVNTILDFYTILITRYIIDFITKNKIDVLHVHDLHILGAAIEARKKQDFILIGDLHENYADAIKYYKFSTTFPGNILISPKKWKRKEKEWISKCDYVVTVVDEMKERVSAFIEKDKIIVYGNYPNLRKFL
ncbi:MAG: glycosyltransferase, partial [Patescibacteria group bacterium]|nr:glycosyltransferase [Patescibacteria group bacterium]